MIGEHSYKGSVKVVYDGKKIPHGEGTMLFKDGSSYSGNWNDGVQNGLGTLTHTNGD